MNSNQYPGWVYLVSGLMIGLFVAFIVYLREQPEQPSSDKTPIPKISDAPKPQFDFYKILPELEVVVPGLEVFNDKEESSASTTPPLPSPTPTLNTGEQFILQAGSFKNFEEADKLKASLALLGIEAHIQKVSVDNKAWHRVRIGPYDSPQALNTIRRRLKANDIKAITLKVNG